MSKRLLPTLLLCCIVAVPAFAEDAKVQPGDLISWQKKLPKAFERAKEKQQVLMICVNAKYVDGKNREEPAAQGLREIIYKDVRVVAKSRKFVCAYLTPTGNSADYGELRALGIEGLIVSPQHIFVHPNGQRILERQEYWSHGSGESAVKALLGMMDKALAKAKTAVETPEQPADGAEGPAPEAGPDVAPPADSGAAASEAQQKERAAWIARMLDMVVNGGAEERDTACASLVRNDKEGDSINPLLTLIKPNEKKPEILISIIRAVGVPGLEKAVEPIAEQLKHKDRLVRGNAAVTLEYVGSKAAIKSLKARASREKDEAIANHMYRALGRCGANDSGVRGVLMKKADSGKSEFASLGPLIGLAYFEKDKKARRGLEKLLGKLGVPGGRGSWSNGTKRVVTGWSLAEIGDEKSGKFVREKFLEQLEKSSSRWKGALMRFYSAVAEKCEGDAEAMDAIQGGVQRTLEYSRPEWSLGDEMRADRDTSKFEPKGEWIGGGGGG